MGLRNLAFIGLGAMGGSMALRLIDRGFDVTVHNRTAAKAAPIAAAGGRVAATPAEAGAGADAVILSLSDEDAVEDVLFRRLRPEPGTVVIDTSTVSPTYARAAAERLAAGGVRRVEACVIANPKLARSGAARILAAGEEDDVAAVHDVLDALAAQVIFLGAAGAAATMKLVFNMLLGVQVGSLAEAVRYGTRAGLDRDLLLTTIANSGFASVVMAFRAEIMRGRTYEPPAFRARLMEKDLRLAVGEAAALGLGLPVVEQAREEFAATVAAGDGDKDAAVIVEH